MASPLIYALVARGTTVLAEYTAFSGNFSTVAVQCLARAPTGANSRTTYTADQHCFNMLADGGFTYMVVSEDAAGRQLPFACLERIKDDFVRRHAEDGKSAIAHALDAAFAPKLKAHMDFCTQNPQELSKLGKVKQEVSQVKNIMLDNIERVLDRGEKIELLVDKTENLRSQADTFHRTGRQLRNRMWWQNLKMKLLVGGVVLGIILIIFLVSCYSGGRNCTAKN